MREVSYNANDEFVEKTIKGTDTYRLTKDLKKFGFNLLAPR
jgi:hypothetical protein